MQNTSLTHSVASRPLALRLAPYLVQLAAAAAVIGLIWLVDPMGWRGTQVAAPTVSPVAETLTQIEALQTRVGQDASDPRLLVELAGLYLQYVRESGDPSYYNKADALLKQALATDPNDLYATVEMGTLSLARHEFRAALDWGNKAVALSPDHWLSYGIVGDANVELGNYPAAEKAFDRMVTLRPDINSYSRISYMRELLGDQAGAIQAMMLATRVGMENTEPSNWARVQLGNLYFNSGNLDEAERLYRNALQYYPDYLHALAGLGSVRAARGDYTSAIRYYQQAVRQIPIPEYVIALGDVNAAAGNNAEAQKQYALVGAIQQLYAANGVDTDLEIALFNADHGLRPAETVTQARAAYARRPSIFAADVLAWALYRAGAYQEARAYSDKALALGMQDAIKYFHSGMIARAMGQTERARADLTRALQLNPHFSIRYAAIARDTLAALP